MILIHLFLRFVVHSGQTYFYIPLWMTLILGGIPLVFIVLKDFIGGNFKSDLLAGISIVTAAVLGEYLAGAIVVLMLSGGSALESFALRNASSVLKALAKRMPSVAHRRQGATVVDIGTQDIVLGDTLVVFPHEICPVDGLVVEGHGTMDEAYLTGEPFQIDKVAGSSVISGAVNGDSSLTIQAAKLAVDSRYAKIMEVMHASEQNRPQLRRLGDQLGAFYTPLAILIAVAAWIASGNVSRFLAVLVVATPCPLIIGIPVVILGSISLAARRGIIIKKASILEQLVRCRTAIFDKTGTLTYGEPELTEILPVGNYQEIEVLSFAASLERYSKHPLARAINDAAHKRGSAVYEATEVREVPGEGLLGVVQEHVIQIAGRNQLAPVFSKLPVSTEGLECLVMIDHNPAAVIRFRDKPRPEGYSFITHLGPHHNLERAIIISGDRESEVRYLADRVGIREIYAQKSPEEKLEIVKKETQSAKTLYVGDGINDAPALMAATVGIAIGQHSDITCESADAVIMDSSLVKVDELIHIGRRMRKIALQSALGGIALSLIGMGMAAGGLLTPVVGAMAQEIIDLLAVINALRAAWPPKNLSDF